MWGHSFLQWPGRSMQVKQFQCCQAASPRQGAVHQLSLVIWAMDPGPWLGFPGLRIQALLSSGSYS